MPISFIRDSHWDRHSCAHFIYKRLPLGTRFIAAFSQFSLIGLLQLKYQGSCRKKHDLRAHTLAMSSQQPLRVSIFPYIPDLANDELSCLKKFISSEFQRQCGVPVLVESKADPYDLKKLQSSYLTAGENAYDIMEVDTVLLGELVKAGCLQTLDESFQVSEKDFTSNAVQSVRYSPKLKDHLYGVPTLQCASFLMELADVDRPPENPLLKDWHSFKELKKAIDRANASGSRHRLLLAGDFRGSWTLPMFYLDAYIDKHGKDSVQEGVDSPVADPQLIENLKEFTDFWELQDGSNPDTDGTFHNHHSKMVKEVVQSEHILMYSYSENMGEVLLRATENCKKMSTLRIISPPLDDSNNLLTYTDAVVVNKHKFSDPKRAELIKKFIKFYTSLPIRKSIALGEDLPRSVSVYPRYVLPVLKSFYSHEDVEKDQYYKQFHAALQHSVPASNHDIYGKRISLQKQLKEALGLKQAAHTQLK